MSEAHRASVAGALKSVLTACSVGRSRVVLIEGAAGCGKSHLLAAVAATAAAQNALVLRAAAPENGHRTPLGFLRQLSGRSGLFTHPGFESAGTAPAADVPQALLARLRRLAAGGPVVLCLDDLQYADAPSLRCLRHVVEHARPAPVLVVAATHPHHCASGETLLGRAPARLPHLRRFTLGPLSCEESAVRAAHPEHTPAELHRLSGGNPFLLHALVDEEAGGPGPDGPFAEAVIACLRRSGPHAPATAQAVAALADAATEPLLARVMHPHPVGPALSALRDCGLLDGLRLCHPRVATAVLASATPHALEALRRRIAQALPAQDLPFVLPAAAASLSAAERGVAALAAQGMTDRQIAVGLYLTVSTVRQHLNEVCRKLALPGRAALSTDPVVAAALAD